MLDENDTSTETGTETGPQTTRDTPESTPPNGTAPGSETAESATAGPPAKKTARKRTTKAAAKRTTKKAAAAAAPAEVGADAGAEPGSDSGPASAVEQAAEPAAGQPGQQGQTDQASEVAPVKKAAKKTAAKRTTKKAAAKRTAKKAAPAAEDETAATATTAAEATGSPATGEAASGEEAATPDAGEQSPVAPSVLFQAPEPTAPPRKRASRAAKRPAAAEAEPTPEAEAAEDEADETPVTEEPTVAAETAGDAADADEADAADDTEDTDETDAGDESGGGTRRRRRRGGRRRRKSSGGGDGSGADGSGSETSEAGGGSTSGRQGSGQQAAAQQASGRQDDGVTKSDKSDKSDKPAKTAASGGGRAATGDDEGDSDGEGGTRRRRRRRRTGEEGDGGADDPQNTVTRVRKPRSAEDEITSLHGSTRLEAKKQRRREGREAGRRRAPIVSEAEFLARREAVDRVMVIRQRADLTQIAVLEDKVLVEHYVARESQTSLIGNVYLGRVQNVLPSMEAAFIDIGKGRNAVLYAGEVNWDALGAGNGPRKIEQVLKSGQPILVQVTKDPIGHKGARLTSQISLPGRFLVYVPDGTTSGISRKLPDTERTRLKTLLKEIVPDSAGVIVRTAAEGAAEDELTRDVERLTARWGDIEARVEKGNAPQLLYGEPDLTLKVVRDLFTEDFGRLVVSGDEAWDMVDGYVKHVAPELEDRLEHYDADDEDVFAAYRIDEQIAKGLDRKVWLPSGGSLIIDRTEAMTVVDVNTGKFTGSGGNLEETVTKNNLEAAEEIVRQLRLRDIGGIIVVDFIDMVLESNRDLVLRRLVECLGRDRTRHQVAEVTSLGLVQMTRKRIGTGLLEAFSETCEHCQGRGLIVHHEPVEQRRGQDEEPRRGRRGRNGRGADSNGSNGNGNGADNGRGGNGNGNGGSAVKASPSPKDIAAMAKHDPKPEPTPEPAPAQTAEVEPAEAEPAEVEPAEVGTAEVEPQESGELTPSVVDAPAAAPAPSTPPAEPVAEQPAETAVEQPVEQPVEPPADQPAVPAGPRLVTSRRRRASRPAGPPAGVTATAADSPDGTGDEADDSQPELPSALPVEASVTEGATLDGTVDDESGDVVEAETPHVPIKKKGSRKR